MLVPPQRLAGDEPERQTLLVAGSSDAVRDAVERARLAGWDTWAVCRTAGTGDWRLTLGRREERGTR